MITEKEFGEKLKVIRKKNLKLTQKELAKKIHVVNTTISKWEDDAPNPSLFAVAKFCEAFDLSLDDLLGLKKTAKSCKTRTPSRSPSPPKN